MRAAAGGKRRIERLYCQGSKHKAKRKETKELSRVRVLVGTRKGAFILSADGSRKHWKVDGPHFAGWEIYHMKGSPADPESIYASQSSSWSGQVMQRSKDGGKTWEVVGNQ